MLAATQLGIVPPEVKSQQGSAQAIVRKLRIAWPPKQREYKSEDVRRIATSLNRSISNLTEAIERAVNDPLVDEREDITEQAARDVAELQKFQRALALPVQQAAQGATVVLPELRTAIPAMMDRVVNIWASMGPIHDIFLGWINAEQAEAVTQGFRDILAVVLEMPGAKSVGFFALHRKKILLGAAVVAAGGGAAWWFMRRAGSEPLDDSELLPAIEPSVPVGVHIFGDDDIPSIEDRTVLTKSGDTILLTGDVDNHSAMSKIAALIAKAQ